MQSLFQQKEQISLLYKDITKTLDCLNNPCFNDKSAISLVGCKWKFSVHFFFSDPKRNLLDACMCLANKGVMYPVSEQAAEFSHKQGAHVFIIHILRIRLMLTRASHFLAIRLNNNDWVSCAKSCWQTSYPCRSTAILCHVKKNPFFTVLVYDDKFRPAGVILRS